MLLGLALVAAAVIFWLPGWLATPGQGEQVEQATAREVSGRDPAANPASPDPGATTDNASPWSEAQAARLRDAAQAALDTLLQLQFSLEEQGAPSWASAEWEAALALASDGDAHYQSREFVAAEASYREAREALEDLEASIPGRLEQALARAEAALQALEAEPLSEALDTVSLIDPEHPQLSGLRERGTHIDTLRELLEAASNQERSGDLEAARDSLEQATQTDPEHQGAREALARVATALDEKRFQQAMGEGYAALDAGDYSTARRAFDNAARRRPNSPEVAAARGELATLATTARLQRLRREATEREQAEDWEGAAARYREALETDASLVFAQEGLARSQPRADLHREIQALLDAPERLTAPDVAREAQALLDRAGEIDDPGEVLKKQRAELAGELEQATTPIPVTLRSDGLTEVTVLRVARLGTFTEHDLSLRPGSYTAVGSRDGYRDVRETFSVSHGRPVGTIHVVCTEKI